MDELGARRKESHKNTERNKGTPVVTYDNFDMELIPTVFPNCTGRFWRYRKYIFLHGLLHLYLNDHYRRPVTCMSSFWSGQNLPRGTMLRILSEFLPAHDRIAVPPDRKISKIY